jgi:hypothetical protein
MTKIKKTQLLLIVAAVVLSVLLYFAPKNSEAAANQKLVTASGKNTETIESFVKIAVGTLTPGLKTKAEDKPLLLLGSFY